MTSSAAAQHSAHAEAEGKLVQKLHDTQAAAAVAAEGEHAAKVSLGCGFLMLTRWQLEQLM